MELMKNANIKINIDGSVEKNGAHKEKHQNLSAISVSSHNGEAILSFNMMPGEGDNFLPYNADIYNNGAIRIRQENPHDGIDDVYLLGQKAKVDLVDDVFGCNMDEITSLIKSQPALEKPSLIDRVFKR